METVTTFTETTAKTSRAVGTMELAANVDVRVVKSVPDVDVVKGVVRVAECHHT